jgi:hypothetical protein
MAATKPLVRPDLAIADLDGEAVVYVPAQERFHYLNHPAALVLDLCDGTATMRQMAEAIADVYEMPLETVESDVRTLVRDLRSRGLVLSSGEKPQDVLAATAAELDEREQVRLEVPRSS